MTIAVQPVAPPAADAAFEALYRSEFRRVVRIARRIVGGEAEAEDVAQDVFAALARRRDALGPSTPAWLHATAVCRALDAARSRRRRTAREDRSAVHALTARDDDTDPLDAIVRTERASAVRAVMRRLRPRDAALLAMRYGGDLSYRELADALGIPPEHVGPLLGRARAAFAREVHRAPRAAVIALGTALVALLTLAALPPVRAVATDIARRLEMMPAWHFRPGGMTFVGSDLERLTGSTSRTERVRGPGFRVRFPDALDAALRSNRRVDVEPFRLRTTYRLGAARARSAGMTLPRDLDGATIDVAVGPAVDVRYGDRLTVSEVATPVVRVRHATPRRLAAWVAGDPTVPNALRDVVRGLDDPFVALPLPEPFDARFPRRSARRVQVNGIPAIAASRDGASSVAWVQGGVLYAVSGDAGLDRIITIAQSLR